MGCSGEKEKIEDKMMIMKLERMEVQMEKEKILKRLSEIEGRTVRSSLIPDYIDPKFAEEKKIYNADLGNNEKTDINGKDDKKEKKGNKNKNKKVKDKLKDKTK